MRLRTSIRCQTSLENRERSPARSSQGPANMHPFVRALALGTCLASRSCCPPFPCSTPWPPQPPPRSPQLACARALATSGRARRRRRPPRSSLPPRRCCDSPSCRWRLPSDTSVGIATTNCARRVLIASSQSAREKKHVYNTVVQYSRVDDSERMSGRAEHVLETV